jgi:hypothetical protein
MSMFPRDLVEIQAHYQSLVEGVEAGTLSYDDAVQALQHIAATDAAGVVWRLDINGNFLAGPVGAEPQLSDPYRFVERTAPSPWSQQSAVGNVSQNYFEGHQGQFDDGSFPGSSPSYGQVTNENPSFSYAAGNPTSLGFPQQHEVDTKGNSSRGLLGVVGSILRRPSKKDNSAPSIGVVDAVKRFRTPLILVGAAFVAALIWTNGSESPSTPLEITSSSVEAPGDNTSSSSTTPDTVDPTSSVEAAGTDDKRSLNNTELVTEAEKLLGQLATGNEEVVLSVIANPGKGNRALLRRAQFAGYEAVGLTLRVSSTKAFNKTNATSELELVSISGEVIVKGKVDMVQVENRWLLKTWPELG